MSSSRVEPGNSVFLSSADMDLGVPMEFQQESQVASHLETWNSAFLLRCKRCVTFHVEVT